ncbi:Manganese transporter smf1 [Microbotryomycetes sp. JL201]|nr:Manganese transporter smf1 [Microbotryomycetes sp. JL201]
MARGSSAASRLDGAPPYGVHHRQGHPDDSISPLSTPLTPIKLASGPDGYPLEPFAKHFKDANDDVEHNTGSSSFALPWRTRAWLRIKRHAAFIGPGVIASVAYIDPGNWSTDLAAGSQFGYAHLFIILLAGLIALLFQILATRLGTVSDIDVSTHCRLALHDRPRHKMFWRWGVLYPLYVLSEIGIIMTDLAELLGSAIAINLLIPQIPLWGAVLLTSGDVFLILLLFSNYPAQTVTRSMRFFEFFIGALVMVVLGSFVALLAKVDPVWKDVFKGYLPSSGIVKNGGIYIAVGIIGATVMPHAFFIGNKIATQRRLVPADYGEDEDGNPIAGDMPPVPVRRPSTGPALHMPQPFSIDLNDMRGSNSKIKQISKQDDDCYRRPSLACVRAHLPHAMFDVAGSLLGFAVLINSSILILAAAVFYYGEGREANPDNQGVSDLFDAFELVKRYLGQAFAYLFAVGLLMAGQSASLTVTLSGQIVSEGFIQWRTTPWKRRLVTRCIGIIPSVAVAASVGRQGIDDLLVGSQVALSIVLTFVLPPLIVFTSQQHVMAVPVKHPRSLAAVDKTPAELDATAKLAARIAGDVPLVRKRSLGKTLNMLNPFRLRPVPEGYVSFANPPWVIWLCGALWLMITTANVYALYDLGRGES